MNNANKRNGKRESLVTPLGTLVWPYLTRPDTKFSGDGVYHTYFTLPENDAKALQQIIDAEIDKAVEDARQELPQGSKKPIKRSAPPYRVNDNGEIEFSFKMRASGVNKKTGKAFSFRPAILDHALKELPISLAIHGGTQAKISYHIAPYYKALVGAGVTLRLQGVQIFKLVTHQRDLGFQVEDGEDIDLSIVSGRKDAGENVSNDEAEGIEGVEDIEGAEGDPAEDGTDF
jgi:hypothetical protein